MLLHVLHGLLADIFCHHQYQVAKPFVGIETAERKVGRRSDARALTLSASGNSKCCRMSCKGNSINRPLPISVFTSGPSPKGSSRLSCRCLECSSDCDERESIHLCRNC